MTVSAITYRSTGTSPGASSTTCVITKPTGLAIGDLMIAQVFFRLNTTISAPDGTWNAVRNDQGGTTRSQSIFWKIATSTETAATNFTFTGTSAGNLGAMHAFSGNFNASFPIDQNNGSANASGTVTSGAVTPTLPDEVIMYLVAAQNNDATPFSAYAIVTSDPGSWTEVIDTGNATANASMGAAFSAPRSQVTSTGNGSSTFTVARANIAQIISIRTPGQGFGQAQATISKSSGFGQAQAWITPARTSRVQKKESRNASTTSGTITLDAAPALGNTLFFFAAWSNTSGPPIPTGGGVTTWTQDKQQLSGFNAVEVYRGKVDTTPSATINFTAVGSADTYQFLVEEWSSVGGVDVISTGAAATSTTISDSVTTTNADDLVFIVGGSRNASTTTAGPDIGYTEQSTSTTQPLLRVAARVPIATGAYTTSWTIASNQWVAFAVSYKLAMRHGFGQAQAKVIGIGQGYGQAQSDIKVTSFGFAQSQAQIKQTYQGYGQAQSDIKQTYQGYAQAQADIKQVGFGFAQAMADVLAVGQGFGQAQAQVRQTYQGYGQSQAWIKTTALAFGQAQGSIRQTYTGVGQAQADVLATYCQFGQAQALVQATSCQWGQAQAWIRITSFGFGQAQAFIAIPIHHVLETLVMTDTAGPVLAVSDTDPQVEIKEAAPSLRLTDQVQPIERTMDQVLITLILTDHNY